MDRFTGILGILAILLICFAFSKHRRAIRPSLILWGVGLQLTFAFIVLRTPAGFIFKAASDKVNALIGYSFAGSRFVFGDQLGGSQPVIFAFQVLPIVIFISSLFSILYYLGVMQILVRGMAILMQRVMGASGAESTNVAASIFMGQTEAPLTIRPFLAGLTESELFTIMTSGMAHVSGAVMAAYVLMAHVDIQHLLTAVIMTAPATIMLAKMLVPEVDHPATMGDVKIAVERPGVNIIDAAARGAGRRTTVGAEHRRHADRFSGADRHVQWNAQLFPHHAAADFRIYIFTSGVAAGREVQRLPGHREPAGHAPGAQRVYCVSAARAHASAARSTLLHDRHLRIVRLCELELHCDSDRWNRCAGAYPQVGPGAAGAEGCRRWNDGQLHVRLYRRHSVVMQTALDIIRSRTHAAPRVAVVLGSGLGAFAEELDQRTEIPYADLPDWPVSTAVGHAGKLVFGKLDSLDVAVMAGRAICMRATLRRR